MARFLSSVRLLYALLSSGLLLLSACSNYSHQLQRGQGYYERNQYELALAVWRNLEADQDSLSEVEMVRYCYLRGMTDFRLGYRDHARYWLGLSTAGQANAQQALAEDERERMARTLAELNREVFGSDRSGAAAQDLGDACKWSSDCDSGFTCRDNVCVVVEDAGADEPPRATERDTP